jgi:hypothetical protein
VITSAEMAPGPFPPVFFNVDTPYFLEKVHTLVTAETYPPNSLSFTDGRRPYHFGVHGMAALIARASGLAPHHALFLLVLPLLAMSIVAAAFVLARRVSAPLPLWVTAPLLLVSVPTLWYPFWNSVGPPLRDAISSGTIEPLLRLSTNVELWGVASNNGQNIASHFIILAALAGVAGARTSGWRLPVFLLGSAVIFKAPTGVALVSGFAVAQAVRVVTTRSIRPLVPAIAVAAVFGIVYGTFWLVAPTPPESMTELFPLFHLTFVREHGGLASFAADVVWLVLPLLIVLPRVLRGSAQEGLPLLALAVAPFVVVNSLRLVDLRPGFGIDDDWLQVMLPVPLVLHVFVLTVAGGRWPQLGAGSRAAIVIAMLLLVLPPAAVAARYSFVLLTHPEQGHEFVDNRPLGAALAAIPVEHSVVVTNDLRYPAEGFSRGNRQMQIPALFGHQAFAVNYAYEAYAFSRDRMPLQKLLQSTAWSDAILDAARANHWTHLVIRRDFVHPAEIPLPKIFESEIYDVYRFPEG